MRVDVLNLALKAMRVIPCCKKKKYPKIFLLIDVIKCWSGVLFKFYTHFFFILGFLWQVPRKMTIINTFYRVALYEFLQLNTTLLYNHTYYQIFPQTVSGNYIHGLILRILRFIHYFNNRNCTLSLWSGMST